MVYSFEFNVTIYRRKINYIDKIAFVVIMYRMWINECIFGQALMFLTKINYLSCIRQGLP